MRYVYFLKKGNLHVFPRSRHVDSLFELNDPQKEGMFVVHTKFIRFNSYEKLNKYIYEKR